MSKISIAIPCYNEEKNIPLLYETVCKILNEQLSQYEYEILFLDNKSTDNSREIIRNLCKQDRRVKAIFQSVNCGSNANAFCALKNSDGDCTILLYADFQEPPELIPRMVSEWEKTHKSVLMIKTKSFENPIVFLCRNIYYKLFKKMSKEVKQIQQFDGFGCYDKAFVSLLSKIDDNNPFLKGLIAEYITDYVEIEYTQRKRAAGKPSLNFWGYYDSAMLSFTNYTKTGLRVATFLGTIVSIASFIIGIVYLCLKILHWNDFAAGNLPILLGTYFLGGCQLLFIGLLGEYVLSINKRVINRPMNIEQERINF